MKTVLILLHIVLVAGQATAQQTVYSVPADSKGNSITLTVANESRAMDASDVEVRLQRSPTGVKFGSASHLVKIIRATKESDITFAFDVERNVRLNRKDTIEFAITDRVGLLGMKSVIVSFTGPTIYKLDQNFPNPFNPSTTIRYELPTASRVILKVYNTLGQEVATPVNETKAAGVFTVHFDAGSLASGMYFYRLQAGDFVQAKKLVVLR